MSKIEVNELAVRTGTNITVSSPIQGEGTAGTTLNQGLLKHFATIQGTDTFGPIDSFNQSGQTDNGTGDYSVANTNAFRDARATRLAYMGNTVNEGGGIGVVATRAGMHSSGHYTAPTTTSFRINIYYGSTGSGDGGAQDSSYVYIVSAGDLA